MPFSTAAGRAIEYEWMDAGSPGLPVLVFLHEGLGSIRQWRDFPMRVVKATGCSALVYNRYGYGNSEVLAAPRDAYFMHDEARIALPELLKSLAIDAPILIGHSDGASIALIHAGSGHRVRGLVVEAPHTFVEPFNMEKIRSTVRDFETTDLPERLGKHHRDVRKTFYGWSDVWLSEGFRNWDIRGVLPQIRCPVMAIQGVDDAYGTMAQLDAIAAGVGGPCELVTFNKCGHSPHREQPEATLAAMVRFVESVVKAPA